MKKIIIYLITFSAINFILSCKSRSDEPQPIDEKPLVEKPNPPTVKIKQFILRNMQVGGSSLSDYYTSFTYNAQGFIESSTTEIKIQITGVTRSKSVCVMKYNDKLNFSDVKTQSINYVDMNGILRDPSKYDTTSIVYNFIYEGSKVTIKKITTTTRHIENNPTTVYEDKEKDYLYIDLDDKNRMVRLWYNSGQEQTFEYDEKGNYIKTNIISKTSSYSLHHSYDTNKNNIHEVFPCSFSGRILSTENQISEIFFLSVNNPLIINHKEPITTSSSPSISYKYEYNTEGYPIKQTSLKETDKTSREFIY